MNHEYYKHLHQKYKSRYLSLLNKHKYGGNGKGELIRKAIQLDQQPYNYDNKFHSFMFGRLPILKLPTNKHNTTHKIKKSVTIGICVRDCAQYMENSLTKLDNICNLFRDSSVVFYENASRDNSRQLLREYCSGKPDKVLLYEDYDIHQYPRTVRLARGRSVCLEIAKQIGNEFYIVLDFDNVISGLDHTKIESSFRGNLQWDAMFANQSKDYYDLWALRTYDDWMNYDCWEADTIAEGGGKFDGKYRNIPKDSTIGVMSAFGGLGIYKLSKLRGCFYYGWKNNRESCEHVHLNKQLTKQGGRLFIIGSLINST